jgi:hypothetical protein
MEELYNVWIDDRFDYSWAKVSGPMSKAEAEAMRDELQKREGCSHCALNQYRVFKVGYGPGER